MSRDPWIPLASKRARVWFSPTRWATLLRVGPGDRVRVEFPSGRRLTVKRSDIVGYDPPGGERC